MNGKKNAWEGIALIPFIDEQRLLAAMGAVDAALFSAEERVKQCAVCAAVHLRWMIAWRCVASE